MTAKKQFRQFDQSIRTWGLCGLGAIVLAALPTFARAEVLESQKIVDPKTVGSKMVEVTRDGFRVTLSSTRVADGGVQLVTVAVPPGMVGVPSGRFEGADVLFFSVSATEFQAVFGIPFGTKSGATEFRVEFGNGNRKRIFAVPFQIADGNYASEALKVDPRHVNPDPKSLKRILREQKEIGALYRAHTFKKHWQGPFLLPIESPVTSPFGTRRVFNGEMRSFHQGLDLKAAVGTPVRSSGNGAIVMAKDLFFTGNTVFVDHGYGMITFYAHLSRMNVRKGQKVRAGEQVGLAGMTGRASGPHLHWGVVINRAKVNPMELLQVVK